MGKLILGLCGLVTDSGAVWACYWFWGCVGKLIPGLCGHVNYWAVWASWFWGCVGTLILEQCGQVDRGAGWASYWFWGCVGMLILGLCGLVTDSGAVWASWFWGCVGKLIHWLSWKYHVVQYWPAAHTCICRFKTEEEAVAIANATQFGLAGMHWVLCV